MNRVYSRLLFSAIVAALLPIASAAAGKLEFILRNADESGQGFKDGRIDPASRGGTLGERRWRVIEAAAAVWSDALHGPLPVVVQVKMSRLPCGVLGSARSNGYITNQSGLEQDQVYPVALAERILQRQLNGDEPDIILELNDAACPRLGPYWHLGLDAEVPEGRVSMLRVAVHELAHGLGFESLVNPIDGKALRDASGLDPFSRLLYDLNMESFWHELTPAQRAESAARPRGLVWGGLRAVSAAHQILKPGAVVLGVKPKTPGISGWLTSSTGNPDFERIEGPVRTASLKRGSCVPLAARFSEHILLVRESRCSTVELAAEAVKIGAVAVLEMEGSSRAPAPAFGARDPGRERNVLPVFRIVRNDGEKLSSIPGVWASLERDSSRLRGADEQGRPFLYTPSPVVPGVSLSHFDSSLDNRALLEPTPNRGAARVDVALERAVLQDIGWSDDSSALRGTQISKRRCDCRVIGSDHGGRRVPHVLWAVLLALFYRRSRSSQMI